MQLQSSCLTISPRRLQQIHPAALGPFPSNISDWPAKLWVVSANPVDNGPMGAAFARPDRTDGTASVPPTSGLSSKFAAGHPDVPIEKLACTTLEKEIKGWDEESMGSAVNLDWRAFFALRWTWRGRSANSSCYRSR